MLKKRELPLPANGPIHLVGVGGTGMSALASLLWQAGYAVSGSDLRASATTAVLVAQGIPITIGHDPAQVDGSTLVVRSSAVPDTNPEIERARALGLQIFNHAEFLGIVSQAMRTLAVSGTHGKTTTTAMLGAIVAEAGLDPTVLAGGILPGIGAGARLGSSDFLVVEADEWQRRFHYLRPEVAVVTSVEADHLDYFTGGLPEIVGAFEAFVDLVRPDGWIVVCADNLQSARLATLRPEGSVTYGLSDGAEWRAVGLSPNDLGGNDFYVMAHDTLVGQFRLRVPGRHNVSNALAAAVAAGRIGVEFTTAAAALERYQSVQRRLERKGEAAGVAVFDDYAHNPTKIQASLAALRERHAGRIVCLFQPHTYHRLASLFDGFVHAFSDADVVVVSDVYEPAGRGPGRGERSASDLAASIVGPAAHYGGNLQQSVAMIAQTARRGDLVVTMGAGDVTVAGPELLAMLAQSEGP